MSAIHPEALLECGYALFLIGVSAGLELMARKTHLRALAFRRRGFTFHKDLDVWQCPEGEHLHRHATEEGGRVRRYRALAHICNGCGIKHLCTDSDQGREITHSDEEWLETHIGRFHRGLSLTLMALSLLILVVGWVRNHSAEESEMFASVLGCVGWITLTYARTFWRPAIPPARRSGPWYSTTDSAQTGAAKGDP